MTTPAPPTRPGWSADPEGGPRERYWDDLHGTLKRRRRDWLQAGNGRRSSAPSASLPNATRFAHIPTRRLAAGIPRVRDRRGKDGDNWTRSFEGTSRRVCGVEVGIVGTQRNDGGVTRRVITIHSGGADLKVDAPAGSPQRSSPPLTNSTNWGSHLAVISSGNR